MCFLPFASIWDIRLPYETLVKTFRISVKFRATKSRRSFSRRTHPIHPIGPETHVLLCFVPFGTVWLPYETRCKTGRTCAKVSATKSRRNFSQRTQPIHPNMHLIHPLNHKLMFWCVSYYLGAFGTVWLPYETRCKTGRTSAKVSATKSRRNFL